MKNICMSCEEIVQIYKENRNTLDKTIENIVQLFDKREKKVSTAESCTGGLLSEMITAVPGASAVFEMGLCTYSNNVKMKLLGVPQDVLSQYGAVSPQTAEAMVLGLKKLSGADLCISVTGLAGPGGGTPECPVGTVFAGILYDDTLCVLHIEAYRMCSLTRENVRHAAAVCAFGTALRMILEESSRNAGEIA